MCYKSAEKFPFFHDLASRLKDKERTRGWSKILTPKKLALGSALGVSQVIKYKVNSFAELIRWQITRLLRDAVMGIVHN